MRRVALPLLIISFFLGSQSVPTHAHEGPDPLSHWYVQSRYIKDKVLESRLGPNGQVIHTPRFVPDSSGDSLVFEGRNAQTILAKNKQEALPFLPQLSLDVFSKEETYLVAYPAVLV